MLETVRFHNNPELTADDATDDDILVGTKISDTSDIKMSLGEIEKYVRLKNPLGITGFVNREDSTLSYENDEDDNLIFTISPVKDSYDIYIGFRKFTISEDYTYTIPFETHSTDLWFVYFDIVNDVLELVADTVFPGTSKCLVAFMYYNYHYVGERDEVVLLSDERHGFIMDSVTHELLHNTIGVRYSSGLSLTENTGVLTLTSGVIYDEDINIEIPQTSTCKVLYYYNGLWEWHWDIQSQYFVSGPNQRVCYNNGNNVAEADVSRYVAYWIFATNDVDCPIYSLMGQNVSNTLADAINANKYENLVLTNLPSKEMKLLYMVIVKSDKTFVEAQDLRSVNNVPATGAYIASDHRALTNIGTMTHDEVESILTKLAGGTTGQVLTKSTNDNYDFSWKKLMI